MHSREHGLRGTRKHERELRRQAKLAKRPARRVEKVIDLLQRPRGILNFLAKLFRR